MTATGRLYITPRELPQQTSGDDWSIAVTLWDGAAVKDVSACTIKACLRDHSGMQVFSQVAQSSSSTGASWSTGVVVIAFTATTTSNLSVGEYLLDIAVTDGSGKLTTWPWVPVEVQYTATRA